MVGSNQMSVQRAKPKSGRPAAIVALIVTTLAFGVAGCMLPVLTMIPSVIGLAHSMYSTNKAETAEEDAANKNQEAETPTQPAEAPNPAQAKAGPANMCQMMALSHPNMVLVELRKNSAGTPEYRELHLLNSADEAHWTPVVDSETGADGWIPAQNFLNMDFQPPLTASIPNAGSCYLAYAPTSIDPNDSEQSSALKSRLGGEVGTFSWGGQVYEYTVSRTTPCLSPSS
jgi:hypothetical protein